MCLRRPDETGRRGFFASDFFTDPGGPILPMISLMELVADAEHFQVVIENGMRIARVSIDIMTADFKAMLIPEPGVRRAKSIVDLFRKLADKGVEIRILHAGVPSQPALIELKKELPQNLIIRRCPRLHAKAVIIDSAQMYLGSANLTGAGMGAKSDGKRNFELGLWTGNAMLIDQVLTHFNQLWEAQHCPTCKRREICPVPLEEPDLT